jgi:hypothetical protein
MLMYPLPGEPETVRSGAQRMLDTAAAIRRSATTLQVLVDGEGGTSKGLTKAISRAHEVLPRLAQAAERYQEGGEALLEFAADAEKAIEAADEALRRFEEAREDLFSARFAEVPEGGEQAHESRMEDLRADVGAAEAAYASARADWLAAGDRAQQLIEDVIEDSPLNDGRFDDLKGLAEDVIDALAPLAELLAEIARTLAGLASVIDDLGDSHLDEILGLDGRNGEVPGHVQRAAYEDFSTQEGEAHADAMFDLADSAYKDSGAPEGWDRLSRAELAAYGITMPGGDHDFEAAVYRGPHGEIVVAYRGSETGRRGGWADAEDWTQNAQNAGGLPTSQGEQAVDLAKQVTDVFGEDVEFTGHSLGGSLAAMASVATGGDATTFNAEGIGDGNYAMAVEAGGGGGNADNVTNFRTSTDPLTIGQEGLGMIPPAGAQITVPSGSTWNGHSVTAFPWHHSNQEES